VKVYRLITRNSYEREMFDRYGCINLLPTLLHVGEHTVCNSAISSCTCSAFMQLHDDYIVQG